MTGPEHYQEAERLLDDLRRPLWSDKRGEDTRGWGHESVVAKAHVHATLALAAAQGCNKPTIIRIDGELTKEDAAMIRAQLAADDDPAQE